MNNEIKDLKEDIEKNMKLLDELDEKLKDLGDKIEKCGNKINSNIENLSNLKKESKFIEGLVIFFIYFSLFLIIINGLIIENCYYIWSPIIVMIIFSVLLLKFFNKDKDNEEKHNS